jgi:RimJ/RimL family protein N-acetyltransferase
MNQGLSEFELERLSEGDLDEDFFNWIKNPMNPLEYFFSSGAKLSPDAIRDSYVTYLRMPGTFCFKCVHLLSGQKFGLVRIGPIDPLHRTGDLVAWIGDKSFGVRGRDVIRRASCLALENLGVEKLYGGILSPNTRSLAAYLAAGWRIEGFQLNHFQGDGPQRVHNVLVAFSTRDLRT